MTSDFYAQLSPLDSFSAITDPGRFLPVPADWVILMTDIRNSTPAIQAGRYKDVNLIGASSITAVLNVAGGLEVPFVFGGDGATVLVPPELVPAATAALQGLRDLSQREFGLELRIGAVPVAQALAAGQQIGVVKYQVSEHYAQALFSGGGLAYAERLIKEPATAALYSLPAGAPEHEVDLQGLECRWQDIHSRYGETVSLLVRATAGDDAANSRIYRAVLEQIERIYGAEGEHHPVAVSQLKPSFDTARLGGEMRLRAGRGWWRRQKYLWRIWFQNHLLRLFVWREVQTGDTEWRRYPALLAATTDYKKYDDLLRMVISGTTEQRHELEAYLQERYGEGVLAYGIHVSDRALLTCLVFERMGRQVHFVDSADGGYALAAVALKSRLAESRPQSIDLELARGVWPAAPQPPSG